MLPTVATDVFELVHMPPVEVLLNVIVLPVHKTDEPVTVPTEGEGLTVIDLLATPVPQALEAV